MAEKKTRRAEVARAAGVAESTVSRALSDSHLISDEVKERVRRVAAEFDYTPNRQAANFARQRSGTIGLVVPRYTSFPPFSRAYFPTLLDGVVLAAEKRGFFVTIVLDHEHTSLHNLDTLIASRSLDGFLFAVSPSQYDRYFDLQKRDVSFVLINNYREALSSVDALPEPGMRRAFDHAYQLGHRRIGYITGDLGFRNGIDRLTVCKTLADEFGLEVNIREGDFSKTSGYRETARLLDSAAPPSLIMTASDRAAIGALEVCRDRGVAVPSE
ncbi:MAG: LacI family transcriptional regulator, partial [Spirochaetales bacterium]|nr:LacI family transcriptional regulator [Spirochaetales bacterium]